MGFKLRGVIRCRHCRQPRGIRHVCVRRSGSKPGRNRVQSPVAWECSSCRKPRGLRHTCGNRGDFKARKRKHGTGVKRRKRKERNARIRAERRVRDRARKAKARARTRSPRPRGESHEPGSCGNRDCDKHRCIIYWRGMDDCPGPHDGG